MAAEQAAPAGAHASSTVHGEDSQRRASHAHLPRQVPYTNVCVHAKGRQADVEASLLIQLSASTTPNNSAASRSEKGQMLQPMQGAHRYMPQHSAPNGLVHMHAFNQGLAIVYGLESELWM